MEANDQTGHIQQSPKWNGWGLELQILVCFEIGIGIMALGHLWIGTQSQFHAQLKDPNIVLTLGPPIPNKHPNRH